MDRLTGLDAGFLYMETPALHMHTLKVAVIDRGDTREPFSWDAFKKVFARCLPLLPPFRRRIVAVPFGLDHPLWINDPDFDLDRHLSHVVLPAPAGTRELCEVVGKIAGTPLSRDKPLWELTAISGLEHGHVGFVAKVHHAVADGNAAAELLMNVLSESPVDGRWDPREDPWTSEPIPPREQLWKDALRSQAQRLRTFPALLALTTKGARALVHHVKSSGFTDGPVPFRTPRTPFNAALTPNRAFGRTVLPLEELKRVRRAFGVTLNDVFLAVCAGALRRYLETRGSLPDRPLVAGVPANSLPGERGRLHGNRVSNLFATLPTEIADPKARLMAIKAVVEDAKKRHSALGPTMLESWMEFTLPGPHAAIMGAWSRFKMADRVRPPINLVVSNVPGPRSPLYLQGARLVALHSVGPILEGIGLNLTAWSYVDGLYIGALACPEHVPDVHRLMEFFGVALEELVDAAA